MNQLIRKANQVILQSGNIDYHLVGDLLIVYGADNLHFRDVEGDFQNYIKRVACYNQDWACPCGRDLNQDIELHHALIQKSDVVGHPDRFFIHSVVNCIAMHNLCHKEYQQNWHKGLVYLNNLYPNLALDWLKKHQELFRIGAKI